MKGHPAILGNGFRVALLVDKPCKEKYRLAGGSYQYYVARQIVNRFSSLAEAEAFRGSLPDRFPDEERQPGEPEHGKTRQGAHQGGQGQRQESLACSSSRDIGRSARSSSGSKWRSWKAAVSELDPKTRYKGRIT